MLGERPRDDAGQLASVGWEDVTGGSANTPTGGIFFVESK